MLSVIYYRRRTGGEKSTPSRFLPWGQRAAQDPEKGSYTVGRSHFEISKGSLAESEILPPLHFEKLPFPGASEKTVQPKPVTPPNVKLFENGIGGGPSTSQNPRTVSDFSRPLVASAQASRPSSAEKLSAIASAAYIPPPKPNQIDAGRKKEMPKPVLKVGNVVKITEVERPKLIEINAKPAQPTILSKESKKTTEVKEAKSVKETIKLNKTTESKKAIESDQSAVLKEPMELNEIMEPGED